MDLGAKSQLSDITCCQYRMDEKPAEPRGGPGLHSGFLDILKPPALASDVDSEGTAAEGHAPLTSHPSMETQHNNPGSPLSALERKRKRLAEHHNKSEQRRRKKINAKLDELQAMVPFSRSKEKAAILLDVIEYIKSVQAQLHIMSAISACDYAAYQHPRPTVDPYLCSPVSYGGPSKALPGSMFSRQLPLSPASTGPAGPMPSFGGSFASYGVQRTSSMSGPCNNNEANGWSLSTGESSPPFGPPIDTTASSYEPLLY